MLRVIRNWQQIGENMIALQREGLPLHETPQKNFDHFLLREIVAGMDKDAAIVDLGCGRAHTLSFLHALRFSNLRGIDLALDRWAHARQALLRLRERTLRPPYRLARGDLTRTSLRSASQDVALELDDRIWGRCRAVFRRSSAGSAIGRAPARYDRPLGEQD
jgi:hypothetical protein